MDSGKPRSVLLFVFVLLTVAAWVFLILWEIVMRGLQRNP